MLFSQVNHSLQSLMNQIEHRQIGLPDIQRPFVWPNSKVRDLFDSMYRGYPVGYLLFWQNALTDATRLIGDSGRQAVPNYLIVDGQQRLTSLFAVIKGKRVLKKNFEEAKIEIAFSPLQEKFEVADAAIQRDRSYIDDISKIWGEEADLFTLADDYLSQLSAVRELSSQEVQAIRRAITKVHSLQNFPFTVLVLEAGVSEEEVAEVFVRINSRGTPLKQADFILTLMSVFWDEGRAELEQFARESRKPGDGVANPYNHFIKPDPDQLLRVAVALGFRRARLQHVYSILRGKDLETEEFSDERRTEQFEILRKAQSRVLNVLHWHEFLKSIAQAGYRGGSTISSNNNLIYSYVFYLLGKTEFGVANAELRRIIARWFFMCSLTGRYTGSPESAMEFDLARLREAQTADEFVGILQNICDTTLTSDFWNITLPNDLATSAARSPSLFAYYASLVLLDAKALFSKLKVTDLMDPSVHSRRRAVERHHLFPKAYLASVGIKGMKRTNQIANFALLEWSDNMKVGAQSPASYLGGLVNERQLSDQEIRRQYYWHALPDGWESMEYEEFLEKRRELMAGVIRDAYETKLGGGQEANVEMDSTSLPELISQGEGKQVEFKATLRVNRHTGKPDSRMELAVLKTIAGFLNGNGGTLVVGVADDGTPVGLDEDGFTSEDKVNLHLVNLIRDRIGSQHSIYIHPRFETLEGVRVLVVECSSARSPVYVKEGETEKFYVRSGAATAELAMSQVAEFIRNRFTG